MSLMRLAKPLQQTRMLIHQQGVGMLEVLIALVLLTTTLLGATALQLTGLQTNRSAYYRSQASILAYDIADRIRLNSSYALDSSSNYSINTASAATPSSPNCISSTSGCSEANLRAQDLREWSENFFDVNGIDKDGTAYRAVLPNGVGVVTASGATFSVEVTWDEVDWNIGADTNKADKTKSFTLDFTLAN